MIVPGANELPERVYEPLESTPLTFGGRFGAAMDAEQIRMNSWQLRQRREQQAEFAQAGISANQLGHCAQRPALAR